LLCVTHRALVFKTCRQILGNDQDAEDATQEVFERATRYLQGKSVEKPSAYLTRIARNTAYELLKRKRKRLETTPLPEDIVPAQASPDEAEERLTLLAAQQLAEQIRPFITAKQYKRLQTRIAEGAGRISEDEAAAALEIKQSSLHATDAQMSKILTDAAIAARFTAAPTCDCIARLAHEEPSRALAKKIEAHIETCQVCTDRRAREKRRIYETFYSLPGVLTVPSGAKLVAIKKGLIVGGVGAAACLTIAVVKTSPFTTDLPAEQAAPPPVAASATTFPTATVVAQAPTSVAPPKSTPVTLPSPRPPSNAPTHPATPPPAVRTDTPLTITVGPDAIGNRTITPTGCAGPKTSAIRVGITSSDGIYLVRLATQLNNKTNTTEMRNTGGSTWTGTVGPYQSTKGGPVRIAVVAVDKGGRIAERYIGTVTLDPCGR
jgi:RNA polymerase sigma factor (sigma-70 family)